MKSLTFYLIRHGKTQWNEQGLLQGSQDSPLTKTGCEQAKLTGQTLSKIPFVAAYSSGLKRAIDTAKYILNGRNIPLFQHIGLNEQDFGKWERKPVNGLKELEEYQLLSNFPLKYKALISQGETYDKFAQRVKQSIDHIIQIHQTGNILIVSHGNTLRLLLALFSGATWQNHREPKYLKMPTNSSISTVHILQEKESTTKFILGNINNTDHLK
ncbi:histidine phosphatase family protein [Lonepinella koalarum]|uniref:histidine phosphatase family protein n=1 Tax=Lonepinella koalarum TaxID=53417 RepID=UPI003F6DE4EA